MNSYELTLSENDARLPVLIAAAKSRSAVDPVKLGLPEGAHLFAVEMAMEYYPTKIEFRPLRSKKPFSSRDTEAVYSITLCDKNLAS